MKLTKKLLAILLTVASLISVFAMAAGAAGVVYYGAATVNVSALNIRSAPSTSASRLGTLSKDTRVAVIDKGDGTWFHINYNGTEGYVSAEYLKDVVTAENFQMTGEITSGDVRMRAKNNTSSDVIGTYQKGAKVDIIGINDGWFKVVVSGKTGYIRSDLMTITGAPSSTNNGGNNGSNNGSNNGGAQDTSVGMYGISDDGEVVLGEGEASELGQKIVDLALKYVGYKYVYGAESPKEGFDCSGLVYYVFGQFGYKLERRASLQYKNNGTTVSKSKLQVGDLVFFSSNGGVSVTHVGIYIGGNKFVHASNSTVGVIISDLTTNYYTKCWFGAKRIV